MAEENKIHMVQALNMALDQEMARDEKVMLMGEDIGYVGGVFRVTEGLQKKYGIDRVVDTPLAERGILGSAFGLSVTGFKPVCEFQFSGFFHEAFDQLVSHVARLRYRSRGRYTCPIVMRMPFGGGIRALEHHSESLEAIYNHLPGVKVVIPSTPYDAKGLMAAAIRGLDPVIFLEPKRVYRSVKQEVPEEEYLVEIGKASLVQEGTDVTMISWGSVMRECREVVAEMSKEGKSVELIDLRTISPIDFETIIASVKKTGRCVIVHEACKTGGLGAEIMATIMEEALYELLAPVERVTGYDLIFPLYQRENDYMPTVARIKAGVMKVLG